MTPEELRALVQLLNRIPMTRAETLWVNELLNRMVPKPPSEPEKPDGDS